MWCVYGRYVPHMWLTCGVWHMNCSFVTSCGEVHVLCDFMVYFHVSLVSGMCMECITVCGMWHTLGILEDSLFSYRHVVGHSSTGAGSHPWTMPFIILFSIPTWTWCSLELKDSLLLSSGQHFSHPRPKVMHLKIFMHPY